MPPTLPIFHSILCLGVLRLFSYFCSLPFSLFLLETQGGPQGRSFVKNASWSGFPKIPDVQRMTGICLKMASETCTFMLCDRETLTFVTPQNENCLVKGIYFVCFET